MDFGWKKRKKGGKSVETATGKNRPEDSFAKEEASFASLKLFT